jgi:hypothetical protein
MSRDDRQSGIVLPNSGVIAAAVLASGTYWFSQNAPLRGSRPEPTDVQISEQAGVQEIDARLWQDPIGAVVAWREKRKLSGRIDECKVEPTNEGPETEKQNENHRCRSPLQEKRAARALGVTLSGARYPQESESRLRTRYAVLAGLDRAGFVPVDEQHLDYFLFHPDPTGQSAPSVIVVPYEWYRSTDPHHGQRVLVFWLDEDALGRNPLETFEELANFLNNGDKSGSRDNAYHIDILGPEWSGTLRRMARETACGADRKPGECVAKPASGEKRPGLKDVAFFTYSSTTPDKRLLSEIPHGERDLDKFFTSYGIQLRRVSAPDDMLANRIKRELKHRGIDPELRAGDHIALITEWDTLYGQTLPKVFKDAFFGTTLDRHKAQVHERKYLRGLDGQLPGAKETRDIAKKTFQEEPSVKDRKGASVETGNLERPTGQSQFDYLRRLAVDLRKIDSAARHEGQGHGIKAIGVLGSDVFDKLLVLQALRPHFPKALFFTTDLDLVLTEPRELGWTRNLIVASSFDLQLSPEIQGSIPPFRSTFQTAAFLSTLVALHDPGKGDKDGLEKISDWVNRGGIWCPSIRLSEIGRTGELISFVDSKETPVGSGCPATDYDIHPPIPKPYPELEQFSVPFFFVFAVSIITSGLALRFVPYLRRRTVSFLSAAKTTLTMAGRGLVVLACIVGVAFVWALVLAKLWLIVAEGLTSSGEPLTVLQGASVWPSLLLRLFAILCAMGFLWYGSRHVQANLTGISKALKINEDVGTTVELMRKLDAKRSPWEKFARMFSYAILRPNRVKEARWGDQKKRSDLSFAWRIYVYQERFLARWWRVSAWLAFSLALVVVVLWDDSTDFAHGATIKNTCLWITTLDLISTMALVIFVFDATLFFWLFVREIHDTATEWPEESRRFWQAEIGVDPRLVDDWIDLEFIAKRTKCIAELVFYPFIVIGLTILSSSTILARLPPSLPFLVIQGAGLLVVVVCAIGLRMEAERARNMVKSKIADEIEKESDSSRIDKLHRLTTRVENLDEGAFRPWSRQPVVHALLSLLGAFGAVSAFDQLAILGL